jgi:DNA polymerase-3 subunit delta'
MIFGHDQQAELLSNAFENLRHHALLLCGPKGIGKSSLARLQSISRLQKENIFPPHVVARQIEAKSYHNYIELRPIVDDEGKPKREITIEQVRNVIDTLKKKSALSGPRIILIDAVDQLNVQSANALLKILEEPPQDVLFVLVCHQISGILPTVRSRCMPISFSPLNQNNLEQAIKSLELNIEPELIPYCLGSVGFYNEIFKAGGKNLVNQIIDLVKTSNLSDLKIKSQTLVKAIASEDLGLQLLHRILYVKALKNSNLAAATQAVERFMRNSNNTHIDATHRLMTAVLLAQDPNNAEIING